jgi:uncharacterized protein (DUF1778 family)
MWLLFACSHGFDVEFLLATWFEAPMSTSSSDARLEFRLSTELKQIIEKAAALSGQTVSDFAIAVLAQSAGAIVQSHEHSVLSQADREAFIELLKRTDARPNKALSAAARRYKKELG